MRNECQKINTTTTSCLHDKSGQSFGLHLEERFALQCAWMKTAKHRHQVEILLHVLQMLQCRHFVL